MKRPLLIVGIVFLTITAVFIRFSFIYAFSLLLITLISIFILNLIFHKKFALFAAIAVTGTVALIICLCHINSANNFFLSSNTFTVDGVITDIQKKGYFIYQLKAKLINSNGSKRVMDIKLITAEEQGFAVGDTVSTKIQANINLKENGYEVTAFNFEPLKQCDYKIFSFTKQMVHLRRVIASSITNILPNYQGDYVNAIIFGFDQSLEKQAMINLNKSGISHITAVSGMQIAFIVTAVVGLLTALRMNKRKASIITILFVLLFAAICGFTASVTRAVIVSIITLVGTVFFKKADTLNSLGFAAALMAALNPYVITSMSFQLSFITSLSIILFAPYIENILINKLVGKVEQKGTVYYFVTMLSASLSVYVILYPFLAITQGYFQPASLFANLATSAVVPIVTIFGLAASLLSFVYIPLAKLAGLIAGVGASYIAAVSSAFANIKLAVIGSQYKIILAVALALFMVLIFVLPRYKLIKTKLAFKTAVTALCACIAIFNVEYNGVSVNKLKDTDITVISCKGSAVIAGVPQDTLQLYSLTNYLNTANVISVSALVTNKDYKEKYITGLTNYVHLDYIVDIRDNKKYKVRLADNTYINISSNADDNIEFDITKL